MTGALDGVRVLDFSRVLAGPLCTMLLGDLGAEVIKIENPGHGDDTRAWGPPWVGPAVERISAYFACVNRNKRSLTLDLKSKRGRKIAQELATKSHIIVENFKPGGLGRFGLGYEDLYPHHPALVYCSITGFGQYGPYHQRPGYDFVIQAMSGLMSITGPNTGEAYKVGVAVSDVFTGLFACNAIQAALRHAERTGQGQHIDMALFDSQLAALVNIGSNFLISGQEPARHGNQHANIVPYQTFQGSDSAFVVAIGNDRQFALLCDLLQQPDLRDDPRYATNPARVANRETLIPALAAHFIRQPAQTWVDDLLALGIPAGPINTIPQALHDPHTQARGMVEQFDDSLRMISNPMHLSATPPHTRYPPPRLGQHNDAILRELLDLSTAQIASLRENQVI